MSDYGTETPVSDPKPARARVVQQTTGRARVLFEGLAEDARKFVQNNFPRPHVEPPGAPVGNAVPDVVLVHDDGTKENYHADDGWKPGDGKES